MKVAFARSSVSTLLTVIRLPNSTVFSDSMSGDGVNNNISVIPQSIDLGSLFGCQELNS